MHVRSALPVLALTLVAACENSATAPRRLSPGAASLDAQVGERVFACTDLAYDGTFHDVVVPAGESCILAYGTVAGNVRVLEGASLYMAGTHVRGNVESQNAASVELGSGVVDGDVVVEGNVGAGVRSPTLLVSAVTLTRGDVRVARNSGVSVSVRGARILEGNVWIQDNVDSFMFVIATDAGGSIHVVANRGAGSTMVRSSTAGRSIRCDANSASFTAASNDAPLMQGQCARAAEVE